MKTITNFKSAIKNITTDKLNIMLDTYTKVLKVVGEDVSKSTCKRYQSVSPAIREDYEGLLGELCYAKSYVNYLNSVNPELLMLYNMGMCEDFYYGSKREVSEAELKVEEIQRKIVAMEEKSQNLLNKDVRHYVLDCNGKIMIDLIKKELNSRQIVSQQSNEQ